MYKLKVPINKTTLFLKYVSVVYELDLVSLLILYDSLGDDVLYFFYILAGKRFVIPRPNKLVKIVRFCEDVFHSIGQGPAVRFSSKQEEKVWREILHDFEVSNKHFYLDIGPRQDPSESDQDNSQLASESGVSSEEHASD